MRKFTSACMLIAIFGAAGLVLAVPAGLAAASPAYAVTDVGDFGATVPEACGGGYFGPNLFALADHDSSAAAINNGGAVVGWSNYYCFDSSAYGFIYTNGTLTSMEAFRGNGFAGWESKATAINDLGQAVGWSSVFADGGSGAFLFSNGVMTNLNPLNCPGSSYPANLSGCLSKATDINDSGQIVGFRIQQPPLTYGPPQGFLISHGSAHDLGSFVPTSIDNAGDIIGSQGADAYLYRAGVLEDLNNLLPNNSGWVLNTATAINNAGQIIGEGTLSGSRQAYLFDLRSGAITGIGSFAPSAINDLGQVVGQANGEAVIEHNGNVVDLNTLIPSDSGWQLTNATGINNRGQIVGDGTTPPVTYPWVSSGGPSTLTKRLQHGFILSDVASPTATPTASPAANASGWNNSNVTVAWNWSDPGSGIDPANCTTTSTSAGEGTITLNASCKDVAGNTGSASYTVKVDKTPPVIKVPSHIIVNATGPVGAKVAYTVTATDNLDQHPNVTCAPLSNSMFAIGTTSVNCVATDAAGNTIAFQFTVRVKEPPRT